MDIKQVFELVNQTSEEVLGRSDILKDDLTGVVQLGDEVFNQGAVDRYVKSLVNRIGKVIFVNRLYQGGAPKVLMDSWQYGSILEKIQTDLPNAQENETWELEDKTSYDPNIFYQPKVKAKFFNNMVTFEVNISITEKQVKQSFTSATQLNAFVSMIYTSVENTMTIKIDSLIMRTIDNFIGETIYNEYQGGDLTAKSTVKAVNLLKLYNTEKGTTLTAEKCLTDKEFLKFATREMSLYIDRMKLMSSLFNVSGKDRFTPTDRLHVVLLSNFTSSQKAYLQSDTYHKELVSLPNYETIPYWQGSGKTFAFDDVSKINIKTSSGHDIEAKGILGVMFDRYSLGVNNYERRVTTNYNPKAEFYTNFYKFDCRYFNDLDENFVVFFVA